MPISVSCPQCKTSYNVVDELGGKRVHCNECRAVFLVPDGRWEALAAAEAAAPPPPPPPPRRDESRQPLRPWPPVLSHQHPERPQPPRQRTAGGLAIFVVLTTIAVVMFVGSRAWYSKPTTSRPGLRRPVEAGTAPPPGWVPKGGGNEERR
jgi:predicted Zn finger-like uncharacterized protein